MAFANYAAYKSAVANQYHIVSKTINNLTATTGRPMNLFVLSAPAGTAPTTAVVPTNATIGGFQQANGGAGTLCIASADVAISMTALTAYTVMIVDILSHQGGLSGTVTTPQTTNLPTAALTRYTSGEGVMMGLTIYSAVGTTGTTVSVSYTNQSGTSGQTSPLTGFGATNYREAGRLIHLPLASGDTGVRSVESVTVTATTGTAGNFGVTLFKPLAMIPANIGDQTSNNFVSGGLVGGLSEIVDNACLVPFIISSSSGPSGQIALNLTEH